MIENPQIGGQGWIITDIWETLCAVPVEIVAVEPDGGGIVCRWHITEEYSEDYDGLKPEELFSTEAAARAAMSFFRTSPERYSSAVCQPLYQFVPPPSMSKGPVLGSLKMMPFKSSTICGILSPPPMREAM